MNRAAMKKPLFRFGNRQSRGAVKVGSSSARSFAWRIGLGEVLLLGIFIIAGMAFYGGVVAIDNVLEVPVSKVKVKASLKHQQRTEITRVINHYLENGFVRVDLARLHQDLLALPWIHEVSIRRQIPDGLLVELVEEEPVAYWNGAAMFNRYGELFQPRVLPAIAGMPGLYGNNAAEVFALYRQLQTALPKGQLPLQSLSLNGNGMVRVTVSSGSVLVLNIEKMPEQLQRWEKIAASVVGERLNEVGSVDLRYSSGAAVEWKKMMAASVTPPHMGGQH